MSSIETLASGLLAAAAAAGVGKLMWQKSRHGRGGGIPMVFPIMLFVFAAVTAMGSVKAFFTGVPEKGQPSAIAPPSMASPTEYAPQAPAAADNPYARKTGSGR